MLPPNKRMREYTNFVKELPDLVQNAKKVLVPNQYVYNGGSSFAVYNAVSKIRG